MMEGGSFSRKLRHAEYRRRRRISLLSKTLKKKHKTVARLILNKRNKKRTKRKIKYVGSPLRPL